MTLIVEDGTGKTDANSYVTADYADAYHAAKGNADWAAATTDAKEQALIRASAFLTNAYVWQGQKVNRRAQALAWPRYGMSDKEGWPVLPQEMPHEVLDACCEIALRELTEPGTMNPDVVEAEKARRLKAGSVEIEYANFQVSPQASRPTLLIVNDLIWPFLQSGSGNIVVGKAYRV